MYFFINRFLYLDCPLGKNLLTFHSSLDQTFEIVIHILKHNVLDEFSLVIFGVEKILE
jgi:hypothetical protein